MNNCPNCGAASEDAANYCVRCGSRMPAGCPNCGAEVQAESLYCQACGVALGTAEAAPPRPATIDCPRCNSVNEAGTAFCYSCGLPLEEFGGAGARASAATGTIGTPAGFWIRLLAWLIDSVFLYGFYAMLLIFVPYVPSEDWTRYDTAIVLLWVLSGLAYNGIIVAVFSTTIGKRVLGLYVLRKDGMKIGFVRAFARHLSRWLSFLVLGLGFLRIAVNDDKRGWHDHICDTVVMRK